jgi:hypothetical protein
VNRSQRSKALSAAKYHFGQLRPTIYRIRPNRLPCPKDCDCKVCKTYNKVLGEINTNENNKRSNILSADRNNQPSTSISAEVIQREQDSQTNSEFSSEPCIIASIS